MVEEQEELVRRAREEHWAVWGLENGLETLLETLRGLHNQAGGQGQHMRLVGPDANGTCQSVGQKIFQCCQPPATTSRDGVDRSFLSHLTSHSVQEHVRREHPTIRGREPGEGNHSG